MPSGLTPRLPLIKGNSFDYELITSYQELIRQNLKNILLTNPGERIMDINFGVGLNSFLFHLRIIESRIKRYIKYFYI